MLSLEPSKDAISSVSSYSRAEVSDCLFSSIQSVCAIWLHDIEVDAQHMVGRCCYQDDKSAIR
jgi:hypothetical protein